MRFSSANTSLTDHSFATGKLIEVNFFPFCPIEKMKMLIRSGANSATGRANRQESLHCLGLFRRTIGLVQTLFHDVCRIDASRQKPVKFRVRLGGTSESGSDRPQLAADGGSQSFRIGGHDHQNETSQEHAQPKRRQASGVLTCIKRDRVRRRVAAG
jgi:hypothetical protein